MHHVARLVCVCMVLGLSGCTLLQGTLSIDQAVARLVPNDPVGTPSPDRFIGQVEIQQATQLWIEGRSVPGTGGQRISETALAQLILLWKQRAFIP